MPKSLIFFQMAEDVNHKMCADENFKIANVGGLLLAFLYIKPYTILH